MQEEKRKSRSKRGEERVMRPNKKRQILESKHRKQSNQQMLSPSLDSFYSKKSTSVSSHRIIGMAFLMFSERFRSSLSPCTFLSICTCLLSNDSGDQRSNRYSKKMMQLFTAFSSSQRDMTRGNGSLGLTIRTKGGKHSNASRYTG